MGGGPSQRASASARPAVFSAASKCPDQTSLQAELASAIARSGVGWAILLEGVNDLGVLTRDAPASPEDHAALVAQLTAGFRQLADRAHAHGIRIIGGTVMPFGGSDYYHPDAALEVDRQAVNSFIRNSGVFDAVIDFDRVMRDPRRPDRLAPAFDSGDHLHPSEAGYRAMGAAVPLALFTTPRR